MHDAALFEAVGVPATAIVTHVFERLGTQTAAAFCLPADVLTVIEHPVWTRDAEWFPDLAARFEQEIVRKLTEGRPAP